MKRSNGFVGLAILSLSLAVGSLQAGAAEDLRVATVDMQRALQTVPAGKKAREELEKTVNATREKIQKEEAALRQVTEAFKKQSLALSDEARGKKQAEIQERIMKFQEMAARSQSELQEKEQELTRPIIQKLRGVISDSAKSKGYTLVLEKNENTVLYSLEKDDITSDVITTFEKKGS
jgi:outer membrane protein